MQTYEEIECQEDDHNEAYREGYLDGAQDPGCCQHACHKDDFSITVPKEKRRGLLLFVLGFVALATAGFVWTTQLRHTETLARIAAGHDAVTAEAARIAALAPASIGLLVLFGCAGFALLNLSKAKRASCEHA